MPAEQISEVKASGLLAALGLRPGGRRHLLLLSSPLWLGLSAVLYLALS